MKNRPLFKLTLFGGFRLVDSDGQPLALGARKSKALLAWLAINPEREHPREKLAALLWPDSEEVAARHSLRQALAGLRKIFPVELGLLNASKEFISLNSELMAIDVREFIALLDKGDADSLDQAIELYSGEFLEGCNPHSDMFNEWGLTYRHDFSERAAVAIETRLSQRMASGEYEQAVNLAMRLLAIDSVRESAYRALMVAHSQLGNHASALRWYRRCQHVLLQELDVAPDEETEEIYQSLLSMSQMDTPGAVLRSADDEQQQAFQYTDSTTVSRDNYRVLYQVEAAVEGILDHIGGQSFLIRGEAGSYKSVLATEIESLAKSHGFFCCRKKLSAKVDNNDEAVLKDLLSSFSSCLARYSQLPEQQTSCDVALHSSQPESVEIIKLVQAVASHQPVLLIIEHIHESSMETLNVLAELISIAGNHAILLLMTSQFKGEALDPVWRGAMRGAPLTTIDMS